MPYRDFIDEVSHEWHVIFDEGVQVEHEAFFGLELHKVCQVLDGLGRQLQRPVGHWAGQVWEGSMEKGRESEGEMGGEHGKEKGGEELKSKYDERNSRGRGRHGEKRAVREERKGEHNSRARERHDEKGEDKEERARKRRVKEESRNKGKGLLSENLSLYRRAEV